MFTYRLITLSLLLIFFTGGLFAASWCPLREKVINELDPLLLARSMEGDVEFQESLLTGFRCTCPLARRRLLQRFRAALQMAEDEQSRQTLQSALSFLEKEPKGSFQYIKLKGPDRERVSSFFRANGMFQHLFERAGLLSRQYHVLVSGSVTAFEKFFQDFSSVIEFKEEVKSLDLTYGYGNYTEYNNNHHAYECRSQSPWSLATDLVHLSINSPAWIWSKVEAKEIKGYVYPGCAITYVRYSVSLPFAKGPILKRKESCWYEG